MPTSGAAPTILRCAESVVQNASNGRGNELVIVQNGELVLALKDALENLSTPSFEVRFVHEPTPSLLAGRHRGVQESKTPLIVFVDDDIEVGREWLDAILSAFEDESVALVTGPSTPKYEIEPPPWLDSFCYDDDGMQSCPFLSLVDGGTSARQIRPDMVWGLNFAIRRSVLLRCGGFHPDGVPWEKRRFRGDGESGLALKIQAAGLRAVYEPKAAVRHIVPADRLTLEYFRKRAFLQGISNSYCEIRRKNGLYETPPRRTIVERLANRFRRIRSGTKQSIIPAEIAEILAAQKEGYEYHQAEVQADSKLFDWVTRENYWDYRYPEYVKIDTCQSNI